MSKRAGTYVTLADLIEEVGKDAVRFTMLTRSADAQMEFDLDKVVAQTRDNPVFYVQYAHARICSVIKKAEEAGLNPSTALAGGGSVSETNRGGGVRERLRFTFPRQRDGKRLCLADFFRPVGEEPDVVGFSLVTVGSAVSELEKKLFAEGDYQDYLYVHGMGVESAEALAEYWHKQIRKEMGIDDQEPADMKLLFSAKYHGARYSFGYPACPILDDTESRALWRDIRDVRFLPAGEAVWRVSVRHYSGASS